MNVAAAQAKKLTENWAEAIHSRARSTGPEWLQSLRDRAGKEFLLNGLPGNKDEAWKYTSLRRLEELYPVVSDVESEASAAAWNPSLSPPDCFGFRVINGKLQWLEKKAPQGVSIMTLEAAFSQPDTDHMKTLRPLLEAVDFSGRGHAFEALNTALLGEGVIIHVAAGVDAGVCLAQWGLGTCTPSKLSNFRLILILEMGAKLRLFEQFEGAIKSTNEPANDSRVRNGPVLNGQAVNLVVQAQLAADASLEQIRLQNADSESILFTFNEVLQYERSSYTYTGFDIGGGLVRHGINCHLAGPGARAEINGAFVLDHERHVDNHICVDHQAISCSSEQFFRGVLGGHSRGVFNGKAVIRPGADGSKVRQSNANLLLSEFAEIDTKPELEIYADEVEASHGATVGQLDEQAVFYLRTRGLTETAARRMLTSAFCRSVTSRLPDAQLADQIAVLLDAAMPGSSKEENN